MNAALNDILRVLNGKEKFIIAMDGRCAAGKTTLAAEIKSNIDCNVIHADDFFLRPEQRTDERLLIPGENIDHERFLSEVLLPLKRGEDFYYRPYNCSSGELGEPVFCSGNKITVIEGAYCCNYALREYYDMRVFIDVNADIQRKRILKRNGERADMFFNKWIPLEEKYIKNCAVRECCEKIYIL